MNHNIPKALFNWMKDPGSFMLRLKKYGIENAQIRILKEGWFFPEKTECKVLNILSKQYVWVREVEIHSDDTIWMFARTVIPRKTLTGKERQLQKLKSRSLGSIVFKYPDLIRSPFEYFFKSDDTLWARRSIFTFQKKSLLLTEVFSSAVEKLRC